MRPAIMQVTHKTDLLKGRLIFLYSRVYFFESVEY